MPEYRRIGESSSCPTLNGSAISHRIQPCLSRAARHPRAAPLCYAKISPPQPANILLCFHPLFSPLYLTRNSHFHPVHLLFLGAYTAIKPWSRLPTRGSKALTSYAPS